MDDLVSELRAIANMELPASARTIDLAADRIVALEGLLERAQTLFAHGVGAVTDNGDRENQERNICEARELMLEITAALTPSQPDDGE